MHNTAAAPRNPNDQQIASGDGGGRWIRLAEVGWDKKEMESLMSFLMGN